MVKCRSVNHDHPRNSGGGKHHLFLRKTATNIKIFQQTRIEEFEKRRREEKKARATGREVKKQSTVFFLSNGSFLFLLPHPQFFLRLLIIVWRRFSKSFRGSAERWHWNISLDAAEAIILAQALSVGHRWATEGKFSKLKYRICSEWRLKIEVDILRRERDLFMSKLKVNEKYLEGEETVSVAN